MAKAKPLFPKLERGGYTARFRFMDESRGERYFDTEWAVNTGIFDPEQGVWTKLSQPGREHFNVLGTCDYRGFTRYEHREFDLSNLLKALTIGTRLVVAPRKHNRKGATYLDGGYIEVTKVEPQVYGPSKETFALRVEFKLV